MENTNSNTVFSTVLATRQYQRAFTDLSRFYDIATRGRDGRCASLIGPSGSGKSTLVTALSQKHLPTVVDGKTMRPIIVVEIPSKPSIRDFYESMLKALGAPILRQEQNGHRRNRALRFMKDLGVRVIVLDEFQHLARKVGTDPYGVCDTIKSLMNESRIGIIFVGVPEAEGVIQLDSQILTRRVMQIRIRAFCDTQSPEFQGANGNSAMVADFQEFKAVLQEYAMGFGCRSTSYLLEDAVATKVLGYTKGVFRVIRDFLEAATFHALERKKDGIDAAAIQEALRLMAVEVEHVEFDQNESGKPRKKLNKMTKREKDLRSANGEFTSRKDGSGSEAVLENDDPSVGEG